MMKLSKKLLTAGLLIGTMVVNTVPVFARTTNFEGKTINYNKGTSNEYTGYATTSTTGSDYVKARIDATYRIGGSVKLETASNTGKVDTQAIVNVTSSGKITATSSYHEAAFYINGASRRWSDYL